MPAERDLVARHFTWATQAAGVHLGVGDDAAVVDAPARLVVTCDTLVEGVHFRAGTDPRLLGAKALAVNLSDLAAMGAIPRHFLLALTLPDPDDEWLSAFSAGMRAMAERHGIGLVGGDLTSGTSTSMTITAMGHCPDGEVRLATAQAGDDLWLSGSIGGAGAELRAGLPAEPGSRLHDPEPRTALGKSLPGLATAATDLSDGLAVACRNMARASGVRLLVDPRAVPLDDRHVGQGARMAEAPDGAGPGNPAEGGRPQVLDEDKFRQAVTDGEDYELLFTAARDRREEIDALATAAVPVTRIGEVADAARAASPVPQGMRDLAGLADAGHDHYRDASPRSVLYLPAAVELGQALAANGMRLAVAESCTGGLLAAALTAIPGASAWFSHGVVCYTNDAKHRQLGVGRATLDEHGAVSATVVAAMVAGTLTDGVDLALAVTGWAGPGPGDDGQPAGTVWIGGGTPGAAAVTRCLELGGDRDRVRQLAVVAALTLALDLLGMKREVGARMYRPAWPGHMTDR